MPIQSYTEISQWNATLLFDTTGTANDINTNLKGVITNFTAPSLSREFDTSKRAGELGIVPRVKHFKEVSVGFTVKAVYKEFLEALVRGTTQAVELKTTACLVADDGTATAYSTRVKGFVSELPFGDLSDDGLEAEVEIMAYFLEVKLGTVSTFIYDPRNYELSVNGTNLYADIKTIIDPPSTP